MSNLYSKLLANSFVTSTGCRLWLGGKSAQNYGVFSNDLVHRIAYRHYHPEENIDGLYVCHTCDVRHCFAEGHLFKGTAQLNNIDKILKGRDNYPKGLNHFRSKVTVEQVKEIRFLATQRHITNRYLEQKFKLSKSTIQDIISRKTYGDIS